MKGIILFSEKTVHCACEGDNFSAFLLRSSS